MRLDRPRLGDDLPTLHFVFFNAAQQQPYIIARAPFVEQLLEHFDAGHHRLARIAETDDLHFFADLANAPLDTSRDHRAAPLDREDVFNRHQEGLVDHALRHRDVVVDSIHQLVHRLFPLRLAVQRAQRADPNHRQIVARELVALQQLADFELDQVEQLRIVHHVDLVHGHHDVGHAHLAGQ